MFGRIVFLFSIVVCCSSTGAEDAYFIYGDVLTRAGETITGYIRWQKEEVLWSDHFNGRKTSNAGVAHLTQEDRDFLSQRKPETVISWVEFFDLMQKDNDYTDFARPHDFDAQFGDIQSIAVNDKRLVTVILKNGESVQLDGGSNDIGADIYVWPDSGERRKVDWSDMRRVSFHPAAKQDPAPFGEALFGRVDTTQGVFIGQVQWDHDERVGVDKLDGYVRGKDRAIAFSDIEAIAKDGRGSTVTLKSGESFHMTGSNDVNGENRGVIVTTMGAGRVDIDWSRFQKVTFLDSSPDDFAATFSGTEPISGQVTTKQGSRFVGRVIFNLDRTTDAEMLHGESDHLRYSIPFREIRKISPKDARTARVTLKNGKSLELAYSNAVSDKNDGIVLLDSDGNSRFVSWVSVASLELD